jgi:hypothetical protein
VPKRCGENRLQEVDTNGVIVPGWGDGRTERTALGRLGEADDVAEADGCAAFLPMVAARSIAA